MYLIRTDGFTCTRETVDDSIVRYAHPSTQQQMLMWKERPRTVLVLKKLGTELLPPLLEVVSFLSEEEGLSVLVEPAVEREIETRSPELLVGGSVSSFKPEEARRLHSRVDFVVCLGGDGVILHCSNLFAGPVPPVVAFAFGSLGFLTSHTFEQHRSVLRSIIGTPRSERSAGETSSTSAPSGGAGGAGGSVGNFVTLRMRLRATICRGGHPVPSKTFEVLNEVVVNRGISPYLSNIQCYERGRLITRVQADGVMISTPTGSSAYSVAAGGSMVHPNVPGLLFTPICPHSLSFRPVVLPDSAELELRIPDDARSSAWVFFDGKARQQLEHGDSVRIRMSEYPMPTFSAADQTADWFSSLVRCLHWNERKEQLPLSEDALRLLNPAEEEEEEEASMLARPQEYEGSGH